MKNAEIRGLETKDLEELVQTTSDKLHQLRLNHAITPLENPSQIKSLRHDIARMKTELRARELNK